MITRQSITKEAEEKTNKLIEATGLIFAFSNKQFDEQKKEGVKYVSIGAGGLVPKENIDIFSKGMEEIMSWKKLEMKKLKPEFLIEYELSNHECYYTGSIEDALEVLKEYDITREQVMEVYRNTVHKYNNT